ncbi:Protein of unknown function [Geoalkalibacter ferrihydriticus]|uniref:DUF721 domain-containing protein n=2 Tax=Geoalkalibacter ferrihydriticus TaxID=392333 RepID=A0A0C2EGZ0_9BACT|nr:DUF721 domain-containing protein [Geoalkalibacter ferrihydriticus]KIH77928.1 hypothetical protein GFER_04755 [Geoalkalibacter ferrihydriticus DSM 17813]SDM36889.1 Protein of unknown function [Geoalkalibacter ferrihydriticus]
MTKSDRGRMFRALPLGEILEQVLKERGLSDRLHKYRAFSCWARAVGPQVAAQTQPLRIRDGILEVRVAHPVWMQQLQLLKPRILARLAEYLGPGVINDLYLRQGRIEKNPSTTGAPTPLAWKSIKLGPAEEEYIAATLATVTDPDLRRNMERVMRRQAQVEKARREAQKSSAGSSSS